ncbi:uncharacterized protein si:dkey-106l3.7 [Esox lucius]|uniref:uncharacterized protein si:dkey-106l3.7 n=1 Tax=Esox lucius TaxID=8010 RepID=UPI001476F892|nr:uncharacterized protein si:dkey-106l3.7 [Esox lucius]
MNLYRSFGSLLETWVTNGEPHSHSADPLDGVALQEWLDGGDSGDSLASSGATPRSKSDLGTLVESDVEDSGVEMASLDPSLPSSPHPLSLGKTEMASDATAPDRDNDELPLSSPCSPVLSPTSSRSSSSLSHGPITGSQRRREMHRRVEKALQRAGSGVKQRVLRPRRQWHSASLPAAPATVRIQRAGNRSASVHLNRTSSLSVVDEQAPQEMLRRRDPSSHHNSLPGLNDTVVRRENVGEEGKEVLSPGLGYLEQVCRMLEEIARLQMCNQELQMEMESLQEQQTSKNSECDQLDCEAAKRRDRSASKKFKVKDHEDLPCQSSHNNNVNQYFRRRSASDTRLLMTHLSKVKEMSEGKCLSVDDLQECPNDDKEQEKKEAVQKKSENKTKIWRLRIGSLKREETMGKTSQQIQPSGKKATVHFRKLFRRRKTVSELKEQNVLTTENH